MVQVDGLVRGTEAVDTAGALDEPDGVPRQVVADHVTRVLKVDAFT